MSVIAFDENRWVMGRPVLPGTYLFFHSAGPTLAHVLRVNGILYVFPEIPSPERLGAHVSSGVATKVDNLPADLVRSGQITFPETNEAPLLPSVASNRKTHRPGS